MTDTAAPPPPLADFGGPVTCRRTGNGLILSGVPADCPDETLILTFSGAAPPGIPDALGAATILALDAGRYRIAAASREWIVAATSLHVHRDVGAAFRRAIPPRPAPLAKRLFWRIVMALAGSRAGKRLLLTLRGK